MCTVCTCLVYYVFVYKLKAQVQVQVQVQANNQTSTSASTYFTYYFFHFSRPPGLGLAFDAAERNRKFGSIQCQKSKESSKREKRGVFFCRRTVRVDAKSKVLPTSSLNIKGRGRSLGMKKKSDS